MKIRKPNLLLFAALTLLCFSCSANDHKAQPVTQPYGMKALPYTRRALHATKCNTRKARTSPPQPPAK